MKQLTEKIRRVAAEALAHEDIEMVVGWQKGEFWWQSPPLFIEDKDAIESLIWDPFCVVNLSKYLLEELKNKKKVALFVKGCDALAVNQLLQDKRLEREQVVLYGLPCKGMVDPGKVKVKGDIGKINEVIWDGEELVISGEKGEYRQKEEECLYDKCLSCRYPNPVSYDQLLAEEVKPRGAVKERFKRVEELEKLSYDERFAYWSSHFDRCIRCFACRNVCPACNCRECLFEQVEPRWLGKAVEPSENQFYHLIRAYHVAGRCIDCGECQRVCPMNIPLQDLSRKLIKEINALFGEYDAGVDPDKPAPLITYQTDDPAGFPES